jgi:hypothetical protein
MSCSSYFIFPLFFCDVIKNNTCIKILTGHKRQLDVATITQGETKFFSILMLAWGNYSRHKLDYANEVMADVLI